MKLDRPRRVLITAAQHAAAQHAAAVNKVRSGWTVCIGVTSVVAHWSGALAVMSCGDVVRVAIELGCFARGRGRDGDSGLLCCAAAMEPEPTYNEPRLDAVARCMYILGPGWPQRAMLAAGVPAAL